MKTYTLKELVSKTRIYIIYEKQNKHFYSR